MYEAFHTDNDSNSFLRTKAREKALESQLEKLAGPNWQVCFLDRYHTLCLSEIYVLPKSGQP